MQNQPCHDVLAPDATQRSRSARTRSVNIALVASRRSLPMRRVASQLAAALSGLGFSGLLSGFPSLLFLSQLGFSLFFFGLLFRFL